MSTGNSKLRGLTDLLRGVPLLAWSLAAFGIGTGAAVAEQGWNGLNSINLSLTVAGGVLFQGIVAHAVNELIDWRSGTDRRSPGILSGGAKVLLRGSLTQRELQIGSWFGLIGALAVAFALSRRVGPWIWWVFAVGCWSSLSYSLPPLRLAYRPFLGEWWAAWPATWTCVFAGARILGAEASAELITAASLHATLSVAWLMQHHLADITADLEAVPQKLTTVAWISQRFGCLSCRYMVAAYFLLAAAVALPLWRGSVISALPAVFASLGALAALRTDPRSVQSITQWQVMMIGLTLMDAVVLGMGFVLGVW